MPKSTGKIDDQEIQMVGNPDVRLSINSIMIKIITIESFNDPAKYIRVNHIPDIFTSFFC
jgi:hypothetical protein